MNDFGPRLPPHLLLKKRKTEQEISDDSDSDDLIGPLPMDQVKKSYKRRSIEFTSECTQSDKSQQVKSSAEKSKEKGQDNQKTLEFIKDHNVLLYLLRIGKV